ncbi:patatin-like phospholipase family protein [Andreprevotia chitinilytica]|uniref:patatin-like phospholipase family protein n=1 Tax=Andreprevotia chitinilytica TaxID=396808 RepID=UPI00146FFAB5|nr:patatin-like phospholipase family protein [Andreprevotia chitinilytica]
MAVILGGFYRIVGAQFVLAMVLAMAAPILVNAADAPIGTANAPRVALVLGGGGARGLAHIGVLKVLEEEHVPLVCVIGTSMGALVGGGYAAGRTPEELEARVLKADWQSLLSTQAPRAEKIYRQKENDRIQVTQLEIGLGDDGKLGLPGSVVSSQPIERFLREMTLAGTVQHFDQLATPFRAIASDLENGNMVVMNDGDIVTAMRASMAVPGLFATVERNGHTLVDGGISRNLPVDIAKSECHADVVIAVDVGTPPLKSEQIRSVLDVADQLARLMVVQNTKIQEQAMTSRDVLLQPDFGGLASTDFDKAKPMIAAGEKAARDQLAAIKRYTAPAEQYRGWLIARQDRRLAPKPIDSVELAGLKRVNPDVVREALDVTPGKPLDVEHLDQQLSRVYGRGDFSRLTYELTDTGAGQHLKLIPLEKDWGPNYLSFGLSVGTDFASSNPYSLTARYRRPWVNSLGAEWLAAVRVGEDRLIGTEFYQPLQLDGLAFVAPFAYTRERPLDFWQGGTRQAEYQYQQTKAGLDIGSSWNSYGEVRAGVQYQSGSLRLSVGSPQLNGSGYGYDYGLHASLNFDQLDSLNFPTHGQQVQLYGYRAIGHGGDVSENSQIGGFRITQAAEWGNVAGHAMLRGHFQKGDSISDLDWLGGLFKLSSYRSQELAGESLLYGRLSVYRPFDFFGQKLGNIGLALESGRVYGPVGPSNESWHYSTTAFWGMETFLGPIYLGGAYGDNRMARFYFTLGNPF